jgi:uncharacterized membrane protein
MMVKLLDKSINYSLLFVIGFIFYISFEVIWSALFGWTWGREFSFALKGSTSVWMGVVGGICFLIVGFINEIPIVRKKVNIFFQSIISMLIITIVELITGLILNIWLGFDIWNYKLPFSFLGQINLFYSMIWFFLTPFVAWADDFIKYHWFEKGQEYSVLYMYKNLFNPSAKSINKDLS